MTESVAPPSDQLKLLLKQTNLALRLEERINRNVLAATGLDAVYIQAARERDAKQVLRSPMGRALKRFTAVGGLAFAYGGAIAAGVALPGGPVIGALGALYGLSFLSGSLPMLLQVARDARIYVANGNQAHLPLHECDVLDRHITGMSALTFAQGLDAAAKATGRSQPAGLARSSLPFETAPSNEGDTSPYSAVPRYYEDGSLPADMVAYEQLVDEAVRLTATFADENGLVAVSVSQPTVKPAGAPSFPQLSRRLAQCRKHQDEMSRAFGTSVPFRTSNLRTDLYALELHKSITTLREQDALEAKAKLPQQDATTAPPEVIAPAAIIKDPRTISPRRDGGMGL